MFPFWINVFKYLYYYICNTCFLIRKCIVAENCHRALLLFVLQNCWAKLINTTTFILLLYAVRAFQFMAFVLKSAHALFLSPNVGPLLKWVHMVSVLLMLLWSVSALWAAAQKFCSDFSPSYKHPSVHVLYCTIMSAGIKINNICYIRRGHEQSGHLVITVILALM